MADARLFKMVTSEKRGPRPSVDDHRDTAVKIADLLFGWNDDRAPILDIDRLDVKKGAAVFIQGPSGSGKSTLLNLLAGVITPQKGTITVLGHRLDTLPGAQRDRFRSDHIGFIFQMFNLIPYLSVIENVTLPCLFSPQRRQKACMADSSLDNEALRLLAQLGLADPELINRPVTDLSVGQQQRVAAARALIGAPEIVIADEPTSSLDHQHREKFIRLLFTECEKTKTTLIFVSHDTSLSPLFDRTVQLNAVNNVAPEGDRGEGSTS